jgi:pyruvate kinase
MEEKRTKTICTLSDDRCDVDFIRSLYSMGMNVVRINSAHATMDGAARIVRNVRAVSDRIALLIDTKGPEVRMTATESEKGFEVSTGDILNIYGGRPRISGRQGIYTNCSTLVKDVPEGSRILIDDASIELTVLSKDNEKLICRVCNKGVIRGKKSINIPEVHIPLPSLTDNDRKFINWAIEADIDFIAHSFVRSSNDLKEIHKILKEAGSHMKIISKIENQQGIDNLEDILNDCYCVMIARGDLGVEIPAERIPHIQKKIVEKCRARKKPVIVATQMLHSMIDNPRPTRAEVTDIANAIAQSTDAIMLSGETAYGKYPVEAVRTMSEIALESEKYIDVSLDVNLEKVTKPIAAVLARSIVGATQEIPVKAIIFDTWTGRTGRYLAEFRPKVPIYAMCYNGHTMREMALTYDVYGYPFEVTGTKEGFVNNSIRILLEDGKISKGDLVGFIGGSFNDVLGATYMEFKYV